MSTRLLPHHRAWLKRHPDKDKDWLRAMFRLGFDIHHIDLNHDNDHPNNLALIFRIDHALFHAPPSKRRTKYYQD